MRPFIRWLASIHKRSWASVFWRSRFSLLALVVGASLLVFAEQSQELFRNLVEPNEGRLDSAPLCWLFVASVLWAVSTWYFARALLSLSFPNELVPFPRDQATQKLATWVPRILGGLTFAAVTASFWRAAWGYTGPNAPVLWILGFLWLLLGVLFLIAVTARRKALEVLAQAASKATRRPRTDLPDVPSEPHVSHYSKVTDLPAWTLAAFGAFGLVAAGVSVASTIAAPTFGPHVGSLALLVGAAGLWIPVGSLLVYLGHRCNVPLLTAAWVGALVFSLWNDNHRVSVSQPAADRPALEERYERWRAAAGATSPVVLVAAEGGGIRAAYWTAAVLARMQDANPEFAAHVFAISTVSGGSLGAAAFASAIGAGPELRKGRTYTELMQRSLGRDLLSPTLAMMLFPDLFQRFLPVSFAEFDRARGTERGWEHALDAQKIGAPFRGTLTSLYANRPANQLPALLLNGTWTETGRRFVISPAFRLPADGDALDGLFAIKGDLALSAATHLSARFPYISPLGRIDGFGHVVDGGYFENSGAATLLEVLNRLVRMGGTPALRPIVVVIRYSDTPEAPEERVPGPPQVIQSGLVRLAPGPSSSAPEGGFLLELLGPPSTLLRSRDARAEFSVAALRERVLELHGEIVECVLRPEGRPLPLGWALSASAREEIDRAAASAKDCVPRLTPLLVAAQ